jgi:hypothetical protein
VILPSSVHQENYTIKLLISDCSKPSSDISQVNDIRQVVSDNWYKPTSVINQQVVDATFGDFKEARLLES